MAQRLRFTISLGYYYWLLIIVVALEQCQKEVLNYDSDSQAVLSGLFSIRESVHNNIPPSISKTDSKWTQCGTVTLGGLQTVELIKWAIELLNQRSGTVFGQQINASFVPGVKIGLQAFDTCGSTYLAVQHVLESQTDTYSSQQQCNFNTSMIKLGVIGPSSLETIKAVSRIMEDNSDPIITFGPSPEDALKSHMLTTAPSIAVMANAMLDLAKQFHWSQAAVIFEEGAYEEVGKRYFSRTPSAQICISDFIIMPKSIRADEYDRIMQTLKKNLPHAPAVFVFGSADVSLQLLQFASGDKYRQFANKFNWVLSDGFGQDNALVGLAQIKLAKGIFVVAPSLPDDLPEFKTYWNSLSVLESDNPWTRDFYQRSMRCRFPDETSGDFALFPLCVSEKFMLSEATQDFFVSPFALSILDAVYGYAVALKDAWFKQCGGRPGLCPQLMSMTGKAFRDMLNVEFTYSEEIRTPPSLKGRNVNLKNKIVDAAIYELILEDNQIGFAQVFKYGPKQKLVSSVQPTFYNVDGTTGSTAPTSGCPNDKCICLNAQQTTPYIYKPGDLILTAAFPVHNSATGSPFGCGEMRLNGYQFAEAFSYALDKINSKQAPFTTLLRGIRLGSLSLDTCSNPARAAYLLGGALNAGGDDDLQKTGTSRLGLKFNDIVGFIGEYNDNVTVETATLLSPTKLPQIAYGAQTAALNDKLQYPTVLRSIVSDGTRLKMTFAVLKELQYDYVQLIVDDSTYGRLMADRFKLEAVDNDVCVAQLLTISSTNAQALDTVIRMVIDKQHVPALVIFAEKPDIRLFLQHLNGYHDSSYSGHFVLFAPDNWANDAELVAGLDSVAAGALTFAPRRLQNAAFGQHLAERSFDLTDPNEWLLEFVETNLHCNYAGVSSDVVSGGRQLYSAACNPRVTIGQIPGFRADAHANDVINAVYAFALGLNAMLEKYCGANYEGLCASFQAIQTSQRNALLYEYIKQVSFEDETGRMFAFTDERDSATPVAVFNLRPDEQSGNGMQYFLAGAYPATHNQQILNEATIHYFNNRLPSSCSTNVSNCMECKRVVVQQYNLPPETTSSYTTATARPRPTTATAVVSNNNAVNEENLVPSLRRQDKDNRASKTFLYQSSPENVILGAIFPIHASGSVPFQCGPISEEGVMMLEAFLWAVDAMNANTDLLGGLILGAFVLDSCNSAGEIFADLRNLYTKPSYFSMANSSDGGVDVKNVWGFINDPSNAVAMVAAEVFSVNAMPNIAPYSPTDALTDQSVFPYTLRTALPYKIQNAAIIDVLTQLNWTYVSVLYSKGMWGQDRFVSFKSEAYDKGICMAYSEALSFKDNATSHINQIISQLKAAKSKNARALVLLTEPEDSKIFVQYLNRAHKSGLVEPNEFVIVGTFDMDLEEATSNLGAIIVHHDSAPVEPFWNYVLSLKYDNNHRNPWWQQFWTEKFKCHDEEDCNEHSLQTGMLPNESVLMNVMNAVWSFAVGLSNLIKQMCPEQRKASGGRGAVCDRLLKQITLREMIYRNVKAAGFGRADNPAETFRYTDEGGPDTGMNVLNLVLGDSAQNLQYTLIGQYRNNSLKMLQNPTVYENNQPMSNIDSVSKCTNYEDCPHCRQNTLPHYNLDRDNDEETTVRPRTRRPTSTTDSEATVEHSSTTESTFHYTTALSQTSMLGGHSLETSTVSLMQQTNYAGNFLYIPSKDGLIIPAIFPLHTKGKLPFTCDKIQAEQYESVQGFLWALKQVNEERLFLSGVQLGALVLDSCSDVSKGLRDLANFLTKQVLYKDGSGSSGVVDPSHTLAVVNSPVSAEALPVANLLDPWVITSVSSGMSASLTNLHDVYSTRYALRTSVPTDIQSKALIEVMKRLKWEALVVLYTDNVWGVNGKTDFETEADAAGICVTLTETVPEAGVDENDNSATTEKVDDTVARLVRLRRNGIRGVLLWLTPASLRSFMSAVKRALINGIVKPGDFTFVVPADVPDLDAAFSDFVMESVGMLAVRYDTEPIAPFQAHWHNLKVNSTTNNDPWIKEYFKTVLNCDADDCHDKVNKVANRAYNPNAYLLNTINAVYAIANGFHELRQQTCGAGSVGVCAKLKSSAQFRRQLFDNIRGVSFTDVVSKKFEFVQNVYGNQPLQIMNLVRGVNSFEFRSVGMYESNELKMRVPPQGFENGIQSFNLRERPSVCMDSHQCPICKFLYNVTLAFNESNKIAMSPSIMEHELLESGLQTLASAVGIKSPQISITVGSVRAMQDAIIVPPSRKFTVAGIFAVHKPGTQSFTCGAFNPTSGFQKLAAFLYALREVNRDPYVLPGIELGGIAIDSCSSEERAMADLFEFLSHASTDPNSESRIKAEDVISVVGSGDKAGSANLHKLLQYLEIPQVSSTAVSMASHNDPWMLGTVPTDETHVNVYIEMAVLMKWTYVSVLSEVGSAYETTVTYFRERANKQGICIGKHARLSETASNEEAQIVVRQLVMTSGSRSVFVFLSNRNLLQFMKALIAERVPVGRFLLITTFNEDWATDPEFLATLPRFGQSLLTVDNQAYNLTNFFNYVNSFTPQRHHPLPDAWFDEFWQHAFQCVLNSSKRPQYQFTSPCTGRERLNGSEFDISSSVLPTVLAVHTVAKGLQRFLERYCPAKPVTSLEECLLHNPKGQFLKELKSVNFTYSHEPGKDPIWVSFDQNGFVKFDYSLRTLFRDSDGNYKTQDVGLWRSGTGLLLDTNLIYVYDAFGERKTPESACPQDETCTACHNTTIIVSASKPYPGTNFNTVWGVVVAAFSILGICICLVCVFYFIVTFPVAYGTTVLGYMILFGLMLLYGLSFAYIVTPNDITCPVRRFCTGICWSFVFGPMLVKVVHTWHMRSFEGNLMNPEHQTSPCALFCLAMGVIGVQVIIALEWVILQQPELMTFVTSYRQEPLDVGLWRCDPGEPFETILIISMSYVIVLIFLTTVFSLMTWNTDVHNRESRFIFVASVFTIAIWLAWTLVATRTPYKFRDAAIAVGLVTNAFVILLCLYMRKAYLYNKYRQQAKEFVDNHSGYQASTMGRPFMIDDQSMRGSKGHMAAIGYHTTNPLMLQHMNGQDSGYGPYEGGSEFHTNSIRAHSQNGLSVFEKSSVNAQHF